MLGRASCSGGRCRFARKSRFAEIALMGRLGAYGCYLVMARTAYLGHIWSPLLNVIRSSSARPGASPTDRTRLSGYTLGTRPSGGQGSAAGPSGHDGFGETAGEDRIGGRQQAAPWGVGRSSSLPTHLPAHPPDGAVIHQTYECVLAPGLAPSDPALPVRVGRHRRPWPGVASTWASTPASTSGLLPPETRPGRCLHPGQGDLMCDHPYSATRCAG
jgi:hypothetical protein